jgi:hypothetical protein
MDSKVEVSFEYDVRPALSEIGASVYRFHFNPSSNVVHIVFLLEDFSWDRRRQILDLVTAWQNGYPEDIDIEPVVLSAADLVEA